MYISDRLFSENRPEEVLFSVLMDEEEYGLYSEFQERVFAKIKQVSSATSEAFKGIGGQLSKGNKKFNKARIKKLLMEEAAAQPPYSWSQGVNESYRQLVSKPNVKLSKVDMENFAKVHGNVGQTASLIRKGSSDFTKVNNSMKHKRAGDVEFNKAIMKPWNKG